MQSKRLIIAFSSVLFLLSIFAINFENDRTNFGFIAIFYSVAFAAYLVLYFQKNTISFKTFLLIAIGAQLLSIWNQPNLSIDFYRFIWDGEITTLGFNPFDFKPQDLIGHEKIRYSKYMHEVYAGIGDLSESHYSVYPPINQFYFIVASLFTDSLIINTIILKLLIVLTEIIGAVFLIKTLRLLKINVSRIWFLFLNPLWIIECTGNTHFEGVMISFLFIAFYYILQKKETIGSVFFAIAVQIKLVPLLLLPFFLRFLGWKKAIILYTLTIIIVLAFGLLQLNSSNIYNFLDSLRLYFQSFEFNSFALYYYLQYGYWDTGWNLTKTYAPRLSVLALFIIITLSLYGKRINPENFNWKKLFKRMTIAFFVYLILSSTLHPWYILPLLALSVFTNYTFPMVWSFFIFFSYVFYQYENNSVFEVRLVSSIEYISVIGLFVYEMIKGGILSDKFRVQSDEN